MIDINLKPARGRRRRQMARWTSPPRSGRHGCYPQSEEEALERLVAEGDLAPENRERVIRRRASVQSLESALVAEDVMDEARVVQIACRWLAVPFWPLETIPPRTELQRFIPPVIARLRGIVALENTPDGLMVAMADPSQDEDRWVLGRLNGLDVRGGGASHVHLLQALGASALPVVLPLPRLSRRAEGDQATLCFSGEPSVANRGGPRLLAWLVRFGREANAATLRLGCEAPNVWEGWQGRELNLALPRIFVESIQRTITVWDDPGQATAHTACSGRFAVAFGTERVQVSYLCEPSNGVPVVVLAW